MTSPKPLKIIDNTKSIFISRFSFETTENDIIHFVKTTLKLSDPNIKVYKFNYKYTRAKASFRLTVPENLFPPIMNEKFWPKNTFIREFIFKTKTIENIAKLPTLTYSEPNNVIPKN